MTNIDAELYGVDLFGEPCTPVPTGPIAERFMVPPFTVLNAAEGYWQERKAAWGSLGIKGELGRLGASPGGSARPACDYSTRERGDGAGKKIGDEDNGTSIFDPVLCELAYRWFCPAGGQVVDPFAGGSVRGIVAHKLGLRYWGAELRAEQVEANREQGRELCPEGSPLWLRGDALDLLPEAPKADLLFTCPPYGDLERYSDDPKDISTMEFHTFIAAYRRILLQAALRLRENRFAVIVVGNYRDKRTGFYRDLVGETVRAFEAVGLGYYNEAVLVTPRGSLPIRITKQFEAGRKMGKTHQNVLVFVKGNSKEAAKACREGYTL